MFPGVSEFGLIFTGDIVIHLDFDHNNIGAYFNKEIRIKLSLFWVLSLAPEVIKTIKAHIERFDPGIYRPGRLPPPQVLLLCRAWSFRRQNPFFEGAKVTSTNDSLQSRCRFSSSCAMK